MTFFICCTIILSIVGVHHVTSRQCDGRIVNDLGDIKKLLIAWNATMTAMSRNSFLSSYEWATNINPSTAMAMNDQNLIYTEGLKDIWRMAACVNCTAANCSAEERRRVEHYLNIGSSALPPAFSTEEAPIISMISSYARAKVCLPKQSHRCLEYEPELRRIMETSRDSCKLRWAWEGWHRETGRQVGKLFSSYVAQENRASRLNGFQNAKDMWTHAFTKDDATFYEQIEQAWADVLPLYQQLHAYVRRKLVAFYGADKFPTSGHIPAHLLGNMWAQDWSAIFDLVKPFPNAAAVNLTDILLKQNFSVVTMVQEAEDFFLSLGMQSLTANFWRFSVFTKREWGTEMVCQPSSWDLFNRHDFRIKMCAQVTGSDFATIHHEMGHIQYFMSYRDQPIEFRRGANPGFHEAIGDLIALSAMTPKHLKRVGLLDARFKETNETIINTLMAMALRKIAFLPFGYLIDKYRWSLFDGTFSQAERNAQWWRLRCQLQGVSPPVPRNNSLDFDAGAKYHVAASQQYMIYFYAYIAQFQFHRGLCRLQHNYSDSDFHNCDIFGHRAAGQKLHEALKLGSSVPYPQVLRQLTGTSILQSTAILKYFKPLHEWLQNQNRGYNVTWSNQCPNAVTDPNCNYNNLQF